MNIGAHIKNMNEQGYTVIENVISPGDLKEIQIKFEELIEKYESDFEKLRINEVDAGIIRCMVGRGEIFEKFFYVSEVVEVAKAILGNFIHYSFNGVYTSKKFKHPASVFHTDVPVWTDNVALSINNFYLVDDTTEENGATWLVPGSHLQEKPSDEFIEKNKIQATGKAGSVIMLHSKLYHASGINHTDKRRKCMVNLMRRSFMKPQFNWQKVISPEMAARMNEDTKRLFDFYTSPPNSPEEYYAEGIRRRDAALKQKNNNTY